MITYNRKNAGDFPKLKYFTYRRTHCFANGFEWYIIDYDQLGVLESHGYSFLEHISEKSWCTAQMTAELFELAKFLHPNIDWKEVRRRMTARKLAMVVHLHSIKNGRE